MRSFVGSFTCPVQAGTWALAIAGTSSSRVTPDTSIYISNCHRLLLINYLVAWPLRNVWELLFHGKGPILSYSDLPSRKAKGGFLKESPSCSPSSPGTRMDVLLLPQAAEPWTRCPWLAPLLPGSDLSQLQVLNK